MPRYRQRAVSPSILPLQWKVLLFAFSLLAGVIFVVATTWVGVFIRIEPIRQAFGVIIGWDSIISEFFPYLVVAGLVAGTGLYSKVRRWFDDQIARYG